MSRAMGLAAALIGGCAGDDGGEGTGSTGEGSGGATTAGSTGEAPAICGLDERPAEGPWLALEHQGAPLVDGGALRVECGFQGLYMFEVRPVFGGFTPSGVHVYFAYSLDIDGENDGPEGHYQISNHYPIYVGCEPGEHGAVTTFLMILEESQVDLEALDGRGGRLRVEMQAPGGPVAAEVRFVIDAPMGQDWSACGS